VELTEKCGVEQRTMELTEKCGVELRTVEEIQRKMEQSKYFGGEQIGRGVQVQDRKPWWRTLWKAEQSGEC
jgi:hypothetical protein